MDRFDELVQIAKETFGFSEAGARAFAIGRDESEAAARARFALADPRIEKAVNALAESAARNLRMGPIQSRDHALSMAERALRRAGGSQQIEIAESWLNDYTRGLRSGT